MHLRCRNDMNAPCIKNGRCSSGFPKPLQENTTISANNKVHYKRVKSSDQWVVPYNPYILKKYDCHVNIEVCHGEAAVKYCTKYIFKGSDVIEAGFTNKEDELINFYNCRYVSAPEAFYRIFRYKIYQKSGSIVELPIHLKG